MRRSFWSGFPVEAAVLLRWRAAQHIERGRQPRFPNRRMMECFVFDSFSCCCFLGGGRGRQPRFRTQSENESASLRCWPFFICVFFSIILFIIFFDQQKNCGATNSGGRLIGATGRGGNEKYPHEQPLLRWYILIVPRLGFILPAVSRVQPFFVDALSSLALRTHLPPPHKRS